MLNGNVHALTLYNGELIAAGEFTTAGGESVNRIAKWNGTSWSPLGSGINGTVYALTVYDDQLIAGGGFPSAGGGSANCIAQWNGTSWSALGSGMGEPAVGPFVKALTVYNGELIAGGWFTTAGGVLASRIAKWNGTLWSSLGSGTLGPVQALIVYNGELIVGGSFSKAGGITAFNIATWNGTSWSAVPTGLSGAVNALTLYNGQLIAGGDFGTTISRIAKWNGTSWSGLGSGIYATYPNARVFALAVYNAELFAGGDFNMAGTLPAYGIAKWNSASWSPLDTEVSCQAKAMTLYDRDLAVGCPFGIVGSVTVLNHWARWGSACPPGDLDADRDVDVDDFALFQECLNGPGDPVPPPQCSVDADLDDNSDVDLNDFAVFQSCFNGPG